MFALLDAHATGLPVLDAQSDFRRARRRQAAVRAACRLARRCRSGGLTGLPAAAAVPAGAARLEVVPLDSIVGAVEPTAHFDHRFRPASEHVRSRWERIVLAHRKGVALPPVVLREGPDAYYVVDGRHRVSVALAPGSSRDRRLGEGRTGRGWIDRVTAGGLKGGRGWSSRQEPSC